MGKSKKKKQQDFQKVKLKVGKKIKKGGDNVTDASFKSRTIQITQQLKSEKDTGPSTKKKQNIRNVLVQCRHYNANVRREAVSGLKDIVTRYPEVITTHLSEILEKSSELLSDKEPSVRQGSLRLFKAVFPRTPQKLIQPFFSMVCAHMCCTMTHIYTDIQIDSLSMFDLLLENYPALLINHLNQVMVNFIEQISRQGQGQRSLSTNLGQKVTSVKWRCSVLGRIEKFLTAFLQYYDSRRPSENLTSSVVWFDKCEQTHVICYTRYIHDQGEYPGFTLRCIQDPEEVQHGLEARFPDFVDTLLPLLLECWVEASPTVLQTNEKDDSVVTSTSIMILTSILNVTKLLLESVDRLYIQKGVIKTIKVKHIMALLQRLFNGFPYSMQDSWDFTGRKTDRDNQGSIEVMNLVICEILTYCLSHVQSSLNQIWLTDTISFMSDFLKLKGNCVGANSQTVAKITNKLVKAGIEADRMTNLVSGMFERFKHASPLSQEKKIYLELFSDLVFDPSTSDKISDDISQKFLQCLPELLPLAAKQSPKMVTLMIQSLKVAASRTCLSFLNTTFFAEKGVEWFGVKDGAILSMSTEDQRELFSLLYFVPAIDINMMKLFTNLVRSDQITDRNVDCLVQVLQNRFYRSVQTETECSLHISFLTSLLLGETQEEAEPNISLFADGSSGKFNFVNCDQVSWTRQQFLIQHGRRIKDRILKNIPFERSYGIWRTQRLTKIDCPKGEHYEKNRKCIIPEIWKKEKGVITVTHLVENSLQVKNIMLQIIHRYLVNHSTLRLQTVLGIFTLISVSEDTPLNMINNLVDLGLSTLLICINCNTELEERVVYLLQSAVTDMFTAVPVIFEKFLSNILKSVAETSENQVILLLKACIMVLREEQRITLLKNEEASSSLKQIIQTVKLKVLKSTDIDTIIADLEYRCSTESFTVT